MSNRTVEMIDINGKLLHVEMEGSEDLPPLVYLHGGPGASCYDFTVFQMERLASHFRVIAFDQRGVLRSDPILDNDLFGMNNLIDDCEALRLHLGISNWSVLGHSFGGHLGVRYAVTYPESINCLVLECPSFDFVLSLRSHLRAIGIEFLKWGDNERSIRALKTANGEQDCRDTMDVFQEMMEELGSQRWEAMHIYGNEKDVFPRLFNESGIPDDFWRRTSGHQSGLLKEGKICESIIPLLKDIPHRVLLLKGKFDLVTCDKQVLAFLQNVPNGKVQVFERSGHFPRIEEPALYEQVVTNFIYEAI